LFAPTGAVGRRGALKPNPKAHPACDSDEFWADLTALKRIDEDAEWQLADVLAVNDQNIGGAELNLMVVLARVTGVEVGHAVDA
jgi:hypothetical protein